MSRLALFERLDAAAAQRPVVVTSTRRLARTLVSEFDGWQAQRDRRVWETPEVLPFSAFVARLYDLAQHDPALSGVRAPLAAAQAAAVWEAVIIASGVPLASTAAARRLADEAWRLAWQWQIADRLRQYAFTDDTRVFVQWSAEFERRVDAIGAIDDARLPDAVRELVGAGRLASPGELVLAGFAELTPQQSALFDALGAAGTRCEPLADDARAGRVARTGAADEADELQRMADWAAQCLRQDPAARLGVVVPDLARRRRAIARALDKALEPAALLAAPDRPRPYTISLGASLAERPLIATALRVLRLARGDLDFAEASALVRSPHLQLADASECARFDAVCRRRAGRTVSLDQLLALADAITGPRAALHENLAALRAWRDAGGAGRQRCSEWAARFLEVLRAVGFPGSAVLDSSEYQTLARWQALLTEFAALERVQGACALDDAVARLAPMAADTVFQPEGGQPPLQVLGWLEAAGLQFDRLWLMGMTSEAWPPAARPHPLLPLELQRARRMPGCDAATELVRASAALDRFVRSAASVIASHAEREGDRPLAPSALIAGWPQAAPVPRSPRAIDSLPPARLATLPDARAPALGAGTVVRGGVATLQNQAACPFRAFAIHRLHATRLEEPHAGLDAAERGQLIHHVLAHFWEGLPQRTHATLAALPLADRTARLARAADHALARLQRQRGGFVGTGILAIERERIVALTLRWLQLEIDQRRDFEVAAVEQSRALAIGTLALNGRIDRIDRLADGTSLIIDYKTGAAAGVGSWLGERPDQPQLPLYLIASETDARAIAFAQVRSGAMRFIAFAADAAAVPGVRDGRGRREVGSWTEQVEAWRTALTSLAHAFASGAAEVDPKRGAQTCRQCDLAALCRLRERAGDAAMAFGDSAEDNGDELSEGDER